MRGKHKIIYNVSTNSNNVVSENNNNNSNVIKIKMRYSRSDTKLKTIATVFLFEL